MSKNAKKTPREAKRHQTEDNDDVIDDGDNHDDVNPQDDNSPSMQVQISQIVTKLNEHSQSLEALQNVPAILASLSSSLGLVDEEEENAPDGEDMDFEQDLMNNFMAETESDNQPSEKQKEDPTMLEILNVSQPGSDYGENLNEAVAKSFACMISNHPPKEKSDKWKELFKPPSNCKELCVPRINPEIWPQLKMTSRHKDLSLQQHGSYISQATVAVSKIADLVFSSGKQMPKEIAQSVLKLSMDAGSILGQASQELSAKRKAELKPHLNKEFVAICSSKTPTTEYLFGDNVLEQLKASKSAANVVKPAFSTFTRSFRMHPYRPQSQHLNFRKPSFQPRGGNFSNRPFRPPPQLKQFGQPGQQNPRRHN